MRRVYPDKHIDALVAQIRDGGGDQLAAARDVRHPIEARLVRRALQEAGWSLVGAAKLLGCNVSALRQVLKNHPEIEAERVLRGPLPLTQRGSK